MNLQPRFNRGSSALAAKKRASACALVRIKAPAAPSRRILRRQDAANRIARALVTRIGPFGQRLSGDEHALARFLAASAPIHAKRGPQAPFSLPQTLPRALLEPHTRRQPRLSMWKGAVGPLPATAHVAAATRYRTLACNCNRTRHSNLAAPATPRTVAAARETSAINSLAALTPP